MSLGNLNMNLSEGFSLSTMSDHSRADETELLVKNTCGQLVVPQPAVHFSPSQEFLPDGSSEREFSNNVLVVDDLPVNRKLVGTQLRRLGYQVDYAENGQAAVEMVKATEYALVFMDLDMPVMDGYQAAIAIRQFDLETMQHTPVLAMISCRRQVEEERCFISGMDELISKRISSKELTEVIRRHNRRSATPEQKQSASTRSAGGDIQLALDTPVKIKEQDLDVFVGIIKTGIGCLNCALQDEDIDSVKLFAQTIELSCNGLGLRSMKKLLLRIVNDADRQDWQSAEQGMLLLESQYKQILDQLTGFSAELHSIDKPSACLLAL
jgi:CheY-like chemotaxis protein